MAIKVLSLFDGMSCGQIALDQLGIEVDTYYASEIDKYAIDVYKYNFKIPKWILKCVFLDYLFKQSQFFSISSIFLFNSLILSINSGTIFSYLTPR